MESLNMLTQLITDRLGPMGPVLLLGGLGLMLVVVALPIMMQKKPDQFAKLKVQRLNATNANLKPGTDLRRAEKTDKLEKFAGFLEPQDAETMTASRRGGMRPASWPRTNALIPARRNSNHSRRTCTARLKTSASPTRRPGRRS